MMTEELTVKMTDAQKDCRLIQSPIGTVIPIVDLIALLGYSRSAIDKARKDHEGKMSPCETFVILQTSGGPQSFLCLNRAGVDYLLLYIHPSKSRMSDDTFLEFRHDILTKMEGVERKEIPCDIRTELQEARELAMICGKSPESFQAVILRKHGKSELAAELKASGEIVRGETGWYTVTGLVELCNDPTLTAERLNHYLANYRENGEWKPFQYKEGKIWRLAPRGLPHGKEYPFNLGNGHSEPRISWRESILVAAGLKRPVSEDQMALPARAV
jgi:hypothetical protein